MGSACCSSRAPSLLLLRMVYKPLMHSHDRQAGRVPKCCQGQEAPCLSINNVMVHHLDVAARDGGALPDVDERWGWVPYTLHAAHTCMHTFVSAQALTMSCVSTPYSPAPAHTALSVLPGSSGGGICHHHSHPQHSLSTTFTHIHKCRWSLSPVARLPLVSQLWPAWTTRRPYDPSSRSWR